MQVQEKEYDLLVDEDMNQMVQEAMVSLMNASESNTQSDPEEEDDEERSIQ